MIEQWVVWERDLFLAIQSAHTPFWDAFMYLISSRWPWIAVAVGLVFFLFLKKPIREALLLIVSIALLITIVDQLTSGVIKPYFARLRPSWHPLTQDAVQSVYGYKAWGYGFVSGHAANFMALAIFTALAFRDRLYTVIVSTLAIVVTYSRIYLGVHFITDVVPGAMIGLIVGYLMYRLYRYLRIRLFKVRAAEPQSRLCAPSIGYLNAFFGIFILFLFAFAAELDSIMKGVAGW